MYYNDDDIEKEQTNWKNSEVMRIFAEQYIDKISSDVTAEETNNETVNVRQNYVSASTEAEASMLLEVDGVIAKLAQLLEDTSEHGNEKAIYLIERAMSEIQEIKDQAGE